MTWMGSRLPAGNLDRVRLQLLVKSSHICTEQGYRHCFQCGCKDKSYRLKKKMESDDQHASRSAACRKFGRKLKECFSYNKLESVLFSHQLIFHKKFDCGVAGQDSLK